MLFHSAIGASAYSIPLYNFSSFTFTTGGKTFSATGPTLSELLATYNTTWYPWLTNTEFFSSSNGIQLWKVPITTIYTIDVYGSTGGNAGTQAGGLGARMKGDFYLVAGTILKIIVGQIGAQSGYAGGGGASGAYISGSSTPLIIAGGGGGGNSVTNNRVGLNASISTSGVSSDGAGGVDGNGGVEGYASTGGGGGWFTNGSSAGVGGTALSVSAIGGTYDASRYGGFGGGGAGFGGGGGGGGYSGGGGGRYLSSSTASGGGGGSINNGTNQTNTAAANDTVGRIIITKL